MAKFTYSPAHRKNVTRETDPYIPVRTAPSVAICPRCHGICRNKRWTIDEGEFARLARRRDRGVVQRRCPACRKIADGFPGGVVRLKGAFVREHRREIRNLIRNEEKRAMGINPLSRIIRLTEDEEGFEVSTTGEKLAQRIGREVHKACRGGTLVYKWSEDSKLLRVVWEREERGRMAG